jgi:hypothetical protein
LKQQGPKKGKQGQQQGLKNKAQTGFEKKSHANKHSAAKE